MMNPIAQLRSQLSEQVYTVNDTHPAVQEDLGTHGAQEDQVNIFGFDYFVYFSKCKIDVRKGQLQFSSLLGELRVLMILMIKSVFN